MFFVDLPLVKDIYGCDTFVASVVYDLSIAKKTFWPIKGGLIHEIPRNARLQFVPF